MPYIHSVTTAQPPHRYSTAEITDHAATWLQNTPHERALFERLASTTRIEHRNFALPLNELLALNGTAERARVFNEVGRSLLRSVITQSLQSTQRSPHDVAALVTTSCSVPAIPTIDATLIDELGISSTVLRLPIFQYGCAGGAIGIGLANHLSQSAGLTLLASIELCSLVYQGGDFSAGNIVGSAIFGDGAACVAISQENGPLRIIDAQSHLIPKTSHLMGYDIFDDGTHLRLEREIPQALLAAAPAVIERFLSRSSLAVRDVDWWLFHPGGPKILSSLEESLNVSRSQTRYAWESLRDYGNMSSASILFALKLFLEEREFTPGQRVFMLGVGPGLTLQLNLFECC